MDSRHLCGRKTHRNCFNFNLVTSTWCVTHAKFNALKASQRQCDLLVSSWWLVGIFFPAGKR